MRLRFALIAVLSAITSIANHLPGGNITYRCMGSNNHEVTLTLYRECSGAAMIPQTLQFSNDCGVDFDLANLTPVETIDVSPLCGDSIALSTCNGGTSIGIQALIYRVTLFLSPCNSWTIGWAICCRNPSINVQNTPGLWIEARLNNAGGLCDASPVFNDLPVPFVCVNQPVSYDCGTVDPDGNTVRYSFIDARYSAPTPTPVNYVPPYNGIEPFTGMEIDSITGMITFTPTLIGYIVTAVQVDTYNADGDWIASVMRDYPFVVRACSNTPPPIATGELTGVTGNGQVEDAQTLRICRGSSFCVNALFTDPDVGQTLTLTSNVTSVFPDALFQVSGTNPATASICSDGLSADAGTYHITITARDNACPIRGEQHYVYTIIVDDAPNAGTNAAVSVCSTDPPLDLFSILGGDPDPGGVFTEVEPGVYHYVLQGMGGCPADSSVIIVTTVQAANAGLDNAFTICQNNDPIFMTDSLGGTPDPGGVWGAPCGFTSNPWFDPSSGVGGTICYTVCPDVPCLQDVACLSITVIPATDAACIGLGMTRIVPARPSISPNPTSGTLTLEGSKASHAELLDMQGRCIWSITRSVAAGDWSMHLPAEIANGSYVLLTKEGEFTGTSRIEVQR